MSVGVVIKNPWPGCRLAQPQLWLLTCLHAAVSGGLTAQPAPALRFVRGLFSSFKLGIPIWSFDGEGLSTHVWK